MNGAGNQSERELFRSHGVEESIEKSEDLKSPLDSIYAYVKEFNFPLLVTDVEKILAWSTQWGFDRLTRYREENPSSSSEPISLNFKQLERNFYNSLIKAESPDAVWKGFEKAFQRALSGIAVDPVLKAKSIQRTIASMLVDYNSRVGQGEGPIL